MTKRYNLLIDNEIIGWTALEKADPSMGVVFGSISFIKIISGYAFLKDYCQINDIEIIAEYPDERIIVTANIPTLKVINPSGSEIKGLGANIEGMDGDIFIVTILGIPYPFYEEEFPHHASAV